MVSSGGTYTQKQKENEIMIYWEMGLVGALGWIHGYTGIQEVGRMYHMWQGLGAAFRHCDGALSPWSVGGVFTFFLIRRGDMKGRERER